MEKTTLNEYLGKRGLRSPISDYMVDKMRLPHGETERQEKKRIKEGRQVANDYYERRNAAIDEYYRKLAAGEIVEKSNIEQMIERANGHPDKESTQAARRRCEKKGINWNVKK